MRVKPRGTPWRAGGCDATPGAPWRHRGCAVHQCILADVLGGASWRRQGCDAPPAPMASDWGQNRILDFVVSKAPTHVETSSSGHRFRFFVASLSWLGCDALFVSSFCFLRVVVLPVSSYCFLRVVVLTVSPFSSIRRRLHKLFSGKSTFCANFAQNGDQRIVGSVEMSQFNPCVSPDLNLKRFVSSAIFEIVRLIENVGSCSNY